MPSYYLLLQEQRTMFVWKMFFNVSFLLGFFILGYHCSIKPPSYLKPCSLSDPKLDGCCLKHGKEALPFLIKGDKKYNVPNLSPLFLPRLTLAAIKNLHVTMTDIYAYGLEKADLESIRFDVNNKKVSVKIMIPNLQLIGKYDINGQLLVLPINGNGDFNITAVNGEYHYDFEYLLDKKDDEDHLVVKDNDKLTFNLENAAINLENLFNGDELLGKHMNTFLNENWKEVLQEIGGALSETVRSVSRSILTGYFSKISYDQLFLK